MKTVNSLQLRSAQDRVYLVKENLVRRRDFFENYGQVYKMPVRVLKRNVKRLNKLIAASEVFLSIHYTDIR